MQRANGFHIKEEMKWGENSSTSESLLLRPFVLISTKCYYLLSIKHQ